MVDAAFEFRKACREQTRRQLLALQPGGEMHDTLKMMLGDEHLVSMQEIARKSLRDQQEPDGACDIVACSCGARVRLPGADPCQCPTCKRRLQ